MKRKISKQEGLIEVVIDVAGQKKIKTEKIKIRPFVTQTMKIGVTCSRLINTGNFENMKIEISAQMPCYIERAKETYLEVLKFVESRMDSEVDKLEKG